MTDQIKIDFDALSRLSPQVGAVANQLVTASDSSGVLGRVNVSTDGQSPAFLAAQRVTTEAIPKILRVIGNRMTEVADTATKAVRVLQVVDEQGLMGVATSTPTLLPPAKS
ncbi:Uncharacterised protein [Mycobacteroides abscessus subsp. bolletii]|uniref:hypothetical protein n=1 Tax=Mycobacteroides abscessus TaxID=36809 RepID=UPI0009293DF6|nr:hypothetical protein [Mycobacteroides abscessus]SHQ64491.1 Uncharacterised protein [Mycobacteroides abscessus subsp. bolletii]SHS48013.1 Uncharacterised protein [Mycobacteroides abscessus subsp. bolletii]SHT06879.1 Uncharacterised protein [Mycobacteroides abscessus subsp. bolletii]SHT15148.1 Uncharacterised protein [Mycobacteroides abscessus subsp. bolletii]SHY50301.1 Uncharacterised protein [Mycobacteroides abscessus subsp. bolletii]